MAATRLAPAVYGAGIRLGSLDSAVKIVVEVPVAPVPLPSRDNPDSHPTVSEVPTRHTKTNKSFKLHVGGFLSIPSLEANARPKYDAPIANKSTQQPARDPFEGLPFRAFAERIGERIIPAIEAAREEQRAAVREGRSISENAVPVAPEVPHFLPFTRWAAKSPSMRSTFVVDNPSTRKKARLSWYHPDDSMVPRDWFKGGLLEDIKYYNPFGLWSSNVDASTMAKNAGD